MYFPLVLSHLCTTMHVHFFFHILPITKDSYCCSPLNAALITAPLIRDKQRTLVSKSSITGLIVVSVIRTVLHFVGPNVFILAMMHHCNIIPIVA